MNLRKEIVTQSPDETFEWAFALAKELVGGTVLTLHGNLGAGKTCFIQGLAAGLGVNQPVTSPTYTLVQEYDAQLPLFHLDLYRINNELEAASLGLEDIFDAGGITAIEWAERIPNMLPSARITLNIEHGATEDERRIVMDIPRDLLPGTSEFTVEGFANSTFPFQS